MEYCKVSNCMNNNTHVTCYHRCNKCKDIGHGINECKNIELCNKLKEYMNDSIDKPCTITDCVKKTTHITEAHSCLYCYCINSNHLKSCPCNGISICDIDPEYETDNHNILKGHYVEKYMGMGCEMYVRNNIDNGNIEYLFMHSDSWGQYGDDFNDTPRYNAFIYGYILQVD